MWIYWVGVKYLRKMLSGRIGLMVRAHLYPCTPYTARVAVSCIGQGEIQMALWVERGDLERFNEKCIPVRILLLWVHPSCLFCIFVMKLLREKRKPQPDLSFTAVNQLVKGMIHKHHGMKRSSIQKSQNNQLQLFEQVSRG